MAEGGGVLKQMMFSLIKVVSTVLISVAIVLELWNLTLGIDWSSWPEWCHFAFWYLRVATAIHLVEGIVAAVWLTKQSEKFPPHQPLAYGLYTLFVGTIGLQELWASQSETAQV